MLLKKCFLPALTDEIKRRCYVGHNRYRFTFMIGHHLHWSPLTIDDQRGFTPYTDNGIILHGPDIYKYLLK